MVRVFDVSRPGRECEKRPTYGELINNTRFFKSCSLQLIFLFVGHTDDWDSEFLTWVFISQLLVLFFRLDQVLVLTGDGRKLYISGTYMCVLEPGLYLPIFQF